MTSLKDLSQSIREGSFTSIGCYPKFAVTATQEVLSFEAIKENLMLVYRATRDYNANVITREVKQWAIVGIDINYEDDDLRCRETEELIPAAY